MPQSTLCPCGRNQNYIDCCEPIHKDQALAKTAEDLMRSRYTGFVRADGEYLQQSYHPKTRPTAKKSKGTVHFAQKATWLKLEVLETEAGLETDDKGIVEFKAYYLFDGKPDVIHERSTFEKVDGLWYYLGWV